MDEKIKNTINLSKKIRKDIIYLSFLKKTAHLGSSLSCVDIISYIYELIINKKNNNKFILSKGHAASTIYSALYRKKFISEKIFFSYCEVGSSLEEHPSPNIRGIECATGSLGHGFPFANGLALANKIRNKKEKTIVMISDGECNEGTTWEAAMFASAQNLKNLTLIIDYNKWQATGRSDKILSLKPLDKKFQSFGWEVISINGHNFNQINRAFKKKNKKPKVIIANTVKGSGIKSIEDDNNWHYRSPNHEELKYFLKELDK
tara:strand:+ start:39 stop:824 length:786 start_codon:yes stop_codon:yes gene_type:complete